MAFQNVLEYSLAIDPTFWNSYFKTNIPVESELDSVTTNELDHYISAIGGSELRNKANYDEKKKWQVYAFLLEFLGLL